TAGPTGWTTRKKCAAARTARSTACFRWAFEQTLEIRSRFRPHNDALTRPRAARRGLSDEPEKPDLRIASGGWRLAFGKGTSAGERPAQPILGGNQRYHKPYTE